MPTSDWKHIPAVLDEIDRLSPRSIADFGIGFGAWGALCRNLLDARHGRCRQLEWEINIVGYEIFQGYSNPCWNLYSHMLIGDFTREVCREFDLVLMMDSLEHLEAAAGRELLRRLVGENKQVIVSVPNGLMEQGEVYGNIHERHLTTFHGAEFDEFEHKVLHLGLCRVVSIKGRA